MLRRDRNDEDFLAVVEAFRVPVATLSDLVATVATATSAWETPAAANSGHDRPRDDIKELMDSLSCD